MGNSQLVRISGQQWARIHQSFKHRGIKEFRVLEDQARRQVTEEVLTNGVAIHIIKTKQTNKAPRRTYHIIQRADQQEAFFDTVKRAGGLGHVGSRRMV